MPRIYCLLLLLQLTLSKILIPAHPADITDDFLLKDPFVIVEASSSELQIRDFDIAYKKLVVVGKNKRECYETFTAKYRQIVKKLLREGVIPNENSIVHSPVQVNFLKYKRKWEFSKVFVVYTHRDETANIMHSLNEFGLF